MQAALVLGEEDLGDGVEGADGGSDLADVEDAEIVEGADAALVESGAGDTGESASGANADEVVLQGGGDGVGELAGDKDGGADEGELGRVEGVDGEKRDGVGASVDGEEELSRMLVITLQQEWKYSHC